jgi:small subunit ribosomal protein S1
MEVRFASMNPVNTPAQIAPNGATPTEPTSSFADILSEFEQSRRPEGGRQAQALQGTVVTVTPEGVLVDIGRKMEGLIPAGPAGETKAEPELKPGDKLLVTVTGRDGGGYYQLSTVAVRRPKDWSGLEKAFAEHSAIGGVVTEVVKGGLRVDVGTPAFMPASRSGARDAAEIEKLVGQEIQCKIIKLDVADEDVVVDRRTVIEEEEAKTRQKAFAELQEGAVVKGTVRTLTDFGAFVDLGGVDGLLHVADMAWTRVEKPADLFSAGDTVEVKILKINRDTRRISLGRKQLMPDPWTLACEKFKGGDRARGKVTRVADFGAFVELEAGVEGLIHLSEMSWSKKQRKPSDIVKPGDVVDVVVLSVSAADKRIALGLKQALGDPWEETARKYPAGTIIEGPVTSLTKFGAFVELEEGVEGMIHIADITREKRLDHPKDVLHEGQRVRAAVLEVDTEKRRIRLSMKQLEATTADEYIAEHKVGETVSGRLLDISGERARVELGEGVTAVCKIAKPARVQEEKPVEKVSADVSAFTAMLSAKWKQGRGPATSARPEAPRAGQVRSFRIVNMDPAQKRIDVELIG